MKEEYLTGGELTFRVRSLFNQVCLDKGIGIDEERIILRLKPEIEDKISSDLKYMINIATMEDEVVKYPSDWWQWFKQRWFPAWALKMFPIKYAHVWSIHKFPEVSIPNRFVGQEFVHFRILRDK